MLGGLFCLRLIMTGVNRQDAKAAKMQEINP